MIWFALDFCILFVIRKISLLRMCPWLSSQYLSKVLPHCSAQTSRFRWDVRSRSYLCLDLSGLEPFIDFYSYFNVLVWSSALINSISSVPTILIHVLWEINRCKLQSHLRGHIRQHRNGGCTLISVYVWFHVKETTDLLWGVGPRLASIRISNGSPLEATQLYLYLIIFDDLLLILFV